MNEAIDQACAILVHRHRHDDSAAVLPALTEPEAYLVQAGVITALGASVGGWKVAVAGGQPVAAPLLRGSLLASGDTFALPGGRDIKLETELGFTLGRDLPPGPITREALLGAISSVHAAFEVVGARLGEPPQIPLTAFLADNLGNAATVVGPGHPPSTLPDVGRLYRDGTLVAEGKHPSGDPLAAFLAYAARQPDALGGLKRGQLIITGSFTGATLVTGSGHFKGEFDDTPSVELTFTQEERV